MKRYLRRWIRRRFIEEPHRSLQAGEEVRAEHRSQLYEENQATKLWCHHLQQVALHQPQVLRFQSHHGKVN